MTTNYTNTDISEFLQDRLLPGKSLTEKDCAIVKNIIAALVDLQGQILFLNSELEIAGGDMGQIRDATTRAGANVRNVLDSFKPGKNTYTQQELRETVQLVEQTVAQFNSKIDVISGVLSKVPKLF